MTVATRKRQAQGLKVFADNDRHQPLVGWMEWLSDFFNGVQRGHKERKNLILAEPTRVFL
jgi:hypothetical protein